jgi:hypothetical protein
MLEGRRELRSHRILAFLAAKSVRKVIESLYIGIIVPLAPWGLLRAEQSWGKELLQPPGHLWPREQSAVNCQYSGYSIGKSTIHTCRRNSREAMTQLTTLQLLLGVGILKFP